jgi:hypothetical protein
MAGKRMIAPAFVVLASVLLAGCTVDSPAPTDVSNSTGPAHHSQTPTPTPTADPVSAAVTVAGVDLDGQHVSVSGFVEGVIEAGGSCQFVLTPKNGGTPLTVSSTGIANVTTTSCGTQQLPIASFSQGPWSVVLHYASKTASVTSVPVEMEIP